MFGRHGNLEETAPKRRSLVAPAVKVLPEEATLPGMVSYALIIKILHLLTNIQNVYTVVFGHMFVSILTVESSSSRGLL